MADAVEVEKIEEAKTSTEDTQEKDGEEKVPKKKKRSQTKRSSKRTTRKKKPAYNVETHPETGAMRLQELHYLRLITSEQKVLLADRDLQIAKARVNEFQTQANTQMLALQARVKELTNGLYNKKTEYMTEVNSVEEATGLALKDWLIDDDRTLRPIEKEKPSEKKE